MPRYLGPLVFLALGDPVRAQDMPLSQILIAGEGWQKVETPGAKPPPQTPAPPVDGFRAFGIATYTPDRSTIFAALPGDRFLWAMPTSDPKKAAPYAPLRLPRDQKPIEVTGLAADRDGRIYAATELGVQVFDPSGRLCGVLAPAAPGRCDFLAFEGDRLTLWIGDAKFTRKLNTAGAK